MKYVICPDCGAHLDFGEKCDCIKAIENYKKMIKESTSIKSNGQLCLKIG